MQRSLILLVLMGRCFLLVCHLYEYELISAKMSWEDAKEYCKNEHTDLATVFDMNDVGRLDKADEAWIGLRKDQERNKTWHWSLPGVEYSKNQEKWNNGEPNDSGKSSGGSCSENCGMLGVGGGWNDATCDKPLPFICYNESQQGTYHLIDQNYTWKQAQSYCRASHTDLASGHSLLNNSEFNNTWYAECKGKKQVWIGLFGDKWSWSDGSRFSFRNWEDNFKEGESVEDCAVTMRNGKWKAHKCSDTKPFYCYKDKMILIQESKTWEQALTYCRENYNELVSITNPTEQNWVQEKAKNATSRYVWLGLRYTCTLGFWFWVTDEVVSYKNWESQPGDDCNLSGAMDKQGPHKWVSHDDGETYNFICSKN